jgi:hypothetical protein
MPEVTIFRVFEKKSSTCVIPRLAVGVRLEACGLSVAVQASSLKPQASNEGMPIAFKSELHHHPRAAMRVQSLLYYTPSTSLSSFGLKFTGQMHVDGATARPYLQAVLLGFQTRLAAITRSSRGTSQQPDAFTLWSSGGANLRPILPAATILARRVLDCACSSIG